MVKIAATARAMETIGKESVVIAFMLDPSFQKDRQEASERMAIDHVQQEWTKTNWRSESVRWRGCVFQNHGT